MPCHALTAESMPCCCAKPVDSSLVTPIHCCSVQGNLPALLPCAAVQNQLTKALCHCTYSHSANRCAVTKHQCPAAGFTAESMPCCCAKPVDSSLVTPIHCCSVQGNLHALLPCAAVQNQLTKALCHCTALTLTAILQTGVQSQNTNALQQGSRQKACLVAVQNQLTAAL